MSEPRLELVIECEHGEMVTHEFFHGPCGPEHHVCDKPDRCPGGSPRVYDDPEQELFIQTARYGQLRCTVRDIIEALAALEGRE